MTDPDERTLAVTSLSISGSPFTAGGTKYHTGSGAEATSADHRPAHRGGHRDRPVRGRGLPRRLPAEHVERPTQERKEMPRSVISPVAGVMLATLLTGCSLFQSSDGQPSGAAAPTRSAGTAPSPPFTTTPAVAPAAADTPTGAPAATLADTAYEGLLGTIPDTPELRREVYINDYALVRQMFDIPLLGRGTTRMRWRNSTSGVLQQDSRGRPTMLRSGGLGPFHFSARSTNTGTLRLRISNISPSTCGAWTRAS